MEPGEKAHGLNDPVDEKAVDDLWLQYAGRRQTLPRPGPNPVQHQAQGTHASRPQYFYPAASGSSTSSFQRPSPYYTPQPPQHPQPASLPAPSQPSQPPFQQPLVAHNSPGPVAPSPYNPAPTPQGTIPPSYPQQGAQQYPYPPAPQQGYPYHPYTPPAPHQAPQSYPYSPPPQPGAPAHPQRPAYPPNNQTYRQY